MKLLARLFKATSNLAPWLIGWAALILRVWMIDATRLWYDEAFSSLVARLPLNRMVAATAADVHPPLYYLILSIPVKLFGINAANERLVSVIFSMLSLLLIYQLLILWGWERPLRLWCLALLAVAPTQLFYSQEARMYTMLQCLVLLQLYAVFSRRWWLLGAATLAVIYTHNYGLVYTAVIAPGAILRELNKERPVYRHGDPELTGDTRNCLLAFGIPVLAYLPWFIFALIPQMRFVASGAHWVQLPQVSDVLICLYFVTGLAYHPVGDYIVLSYIASVGAFGLVTLSAWKRKRYTLLMLAYAPLVLAAIGSYVLTPMLMFRGLLPSAFAFTVLLVDALYALRSQVRVALIYALGIILTIGLMQFWGATMKGTIKGLVVPDPATLYSDGTLVLHSEDTSLVTWAAYQQPGVTNALLDIGCPEQIAALGPKVRAAMGLPSLPLRAVTGHYYLIASIGALSTRCAQDSYPAITANLTPLFSMADETGSRGYYVNNLLP